MGAKVASLPLSLSLSPLSLGNAEMDAAAFRGTEVKFPL